MKNEKVDQFHYWPNWTNKSIKKRHENWQKALHKYSVLKFHIYPMNLDAQLSDGDIITIRGDYLAPYIEGKYKIEIKSIGNLYECICKGI